MVDPQTIYDLVEAARARQLVPLVGPDFVHGTPSWSSLRAGLEPTLETVPFEETLEALSRHRWSAYELLDSAPERTGEIPSGYHALVRLRAPLIMTTNFDDLIERALVERRLTPSVYTFRRADAVLHRLGDTRSDRPVVFKLFGSAEDPRGAILSTEPLYAAVYEDTTFVSALQLIFAKRTVLALGYSPRSPELDAIRSILDNTGSWPPEAMYAIAQTDDAAWDDLGDWPVNAIPCSDDELTDLLDRISPPA